MVFERNFYLQRLVSKKWNGRIKIITGLRRCGKSYFLFKIFKEHLRSNGVSADFIVELSLDSIENEHLRDPKELWKFLGKRVSDANKKYYLLLDEIQFAISKKELQNHDEPVRLYGVLNGLLQKGNIDIYVTGSDSKMLSHDVATEFRGRGDILPIYPLSFREFFGVFDGDREAAYETYATDVGLRNARLGFRDLEETHIMENIVYNELKVRGFSVDVGVVPVCENGIDGKRHLKNCEIDFIASKGIKKSYFQSAYSLNGDEKRNQEIRPLLSVKDFFEKTVITRFGLKPWSDERGVQYISLLDFLLSD